MIGSYSLWDCLVCGAWWWQRVELWRGLCHRCSGDCVLEGAER